MKKIFFYILSIVALAGCMERSEFVPENSVPAQDMKEYVAPLELTLGGPQTKSYDEDLNWTWEESDKIYGYQVAGGKSVNTLSFVEDNRFGTPEFAYASEDAATFHFVYAGDATLDEAAEGNRGIRQDSRQSGEWRPVLIGSAVGKTISEVMNDEAEINMEHLSAALEVRLWKEGVDKNNLTDADKKNIVYAELMSDTENFLLDIVPVSNQDGTVSYTERERGEDEENGGYIRTEYVNSPVAVFNVAPHAENYQAGALRLAIMDENGDRYLLDVPALNFVAGQRTILNVEWKTPTSAYLPDGPTFNSTVDAFMTGKGITEIKFITNSATTSEDALVDGSIYLVQNGQTLEIHTAASQFVANTNCNIMFAGSYFDYNLSKYVDRTTFKQIKNIDFGENFNTQNVTNMSYMFSACGLTSLDLSYFNTQNVTDMRYMFGSCYGLTSLDLSNFNTQNVTDMGSMFSYCSGLTSLDLSNFNTQNVTSMSSMFIDCSKLASLDVSNFNTQNVTSMSLMFYGCSGLTSLDVSKFNTQNVTNMRYMFNSCSGLTSLDISKFNTQNVTDMYAMFCDCSGLTSLDVSNFNTTNVTDMSSMFSLCSGLTSLDVSNFNTTNVTDMGYMFSRCSGLTSLDVSNFNTTNVTDMSLMFNSCSGLTSLDVSNFNTTNVTDMGYMFSRCSGLTSLDVSKFNTKKVYDMADMFHSCTSLTSLDVSNFNTQKVYYMRGMFSGCSSFTSLDISSFSFLANPSISDIFNSTGSNAANKPIPIYVSAVGKSYIEANGFTSNENCELVLTDKAYLPTGETFNITVNAFMAGKGITQIKFVTNSATTSEDALVEGSIYMVQKEQTLEIHTNASQFMANIDCQNMFSGHYNNFKDIVSIDFGDNFNTTNVTDMSYMFYKCSGLTSLDVSNFNTQNVTDMSLMFYYCSGLTSLDVSNFNTQNVTNMSKMFYCCGLTSLDVSKFNTQNVTNMYAMFYYCDVLTSLDVSNFNTQNVTNMRSMFNSCSGLTSLDVSNFNTQNVTNMNAMFGDCSGLTSLDVSNFNTQNVTDMSVMFYNCSGLTSLDVSKFNTQNVTNMRSMFNSCSGLTSLDVSNFNTQNVTDMGSMFKSCSSFTSLDISSFSFLANPSISDIFNSTGSNAANKPIPIYVTEEGKSYIETTGGSSINNEYATLIIKSVGI